MKSFLLDYAVFPLWICIFGGNFAWWLWGSPFCNVLPGNANIWVFPIELMVVVYLFIGGLLDLLEELEFADETYWMLNVGSEYPHDLSKSMAISATSCSTWAMVVHFLLSIWLIYFAIDCL